MCNKCNGTGWETFTDLVPYGSGDVSMEGRDPCRYCIGANECPVCGEELTCPEDAEIVTCELCGYDSETNCEEIEPETVGA